MLWDFIKFLIHLLEQGITTNNNLIIFSIKTNLLESAKFRALLAKNVLTCHFVLRAHVLKYEHALRPYVLTCVKCVKSVES